MSHIEQAIKEAVEKGGYKHILVEIAKWEIESGDYNHEAVLLDPLFWKALSRAQGWAGEKIRMCVGCGVALKWNENPDMEGRHNLIKDGKQRGCGSNIIEYEGQWLIEWHRFIDHLAEGKDAESFFKKIET
jgi:hypothetical protein